MIVQNTGIQDTVLAENSDAAKILLMNKVIDHFLPLFREEIEKKKKVLSGYQKDYKKLKTEISKTQQVVIKYRDGLKRELVIQEILDDAAFLFSRDILYGQNKQKVLDILDSLRQSDLISLISKRKALRALIQKNVKKVIIN